MKRENLEVLGGLLMIVALPWLAFTEWVTGTQDRDWRGRKRPIAPGLLGCLAWVSFIIQLILLSMAGIILGGIIS